ncbi:MAG: DUF3473 domain-containing protein [Motiliproteus sp.]|nr:DUF3473 domain-containing protein [Motiliproteus sp.]MCW9053299.1 DUF3473 domain-containing protein [Motiliproteus sp.]
MNSNRSFALSFDIEDYFHVSAFEKQIQPENWDNLEQRTEANVDLILELLDSNRSTKATFFILGWIAKRFPNLVKSITQQGHEVASHGFNHQRLINLTRDEFKADISDSKKMLEDLSGSKVIGYRAPSFSLSPKTLWAVDELKEAGYIYSSSVNPVPHDLYGMPNAPRTPFLWQNGLEELPVTTLQLLNRRWPCAGGGYFRLYPYQLSKWALKTAREQLDGPVIFYMHPWELDPNQPRVTNAPLKSRFRHYINLNKTQSRLENLVTDFEWDTISSVKESYSIKQVAAI